MTNETKVASPDLADKLATANRRRMKLRAVGRNLARWCLVPTAITVAILCAPYENAILPSLPFLTGINLYQSDWTPPRLSKISGTDALVLQGDQSRKGHAAQQRAIWERFPQDKVYLHNYLTHLASTYGDDKNQTPEERFAVFSAEVAKLRPLDPDNARFDYLLAGKLLEQAAEFKSEPIKDPPPGGKKSKTTFIIQDRAKLDQAMAFFKAALAKPSFHTYTQAMLKRRADILGPPETMLEYVHQIAIRAGALLPDVSAQRSLAMASADYSEILVKEGRPAEAGVYLDAYKTMIAHTNGNSYTLIEQLVQGAVAGIAAEKVPVIYESMGMPEKAKIVKAEAEALQAPTKAFKAHFKAKKDDGDMIKKHASFLSGILLPSFGEPITIKELAAGRELDFVIAEQFMMAWVSVLLFWFMAVCLVTALYHRFRRGGGAPLLLLPTPGGTLRVLGFGILLPLLAYYLLTRYFPGSGRDFNIVCAAPKLVTEWVFLLLAIFWVVTTLTDRQVCRRCQELNVPVPPAPTPKGWLIAQSALFAVFLLACAFNIPGPTDTVASMVTVGGIAATVLLLDCICSIVSLAKGWRLRSQHRLFYGTRARSLIPIYALAMILLNLASGPFLQMEERRLVQNDGISGLDSDGGLTRIESRITKRLQAETRAALEKIERNARERTAAAGNR